MQEGYLRKEAEENGEWAIINQEEGDGGYSTFFSPAGQIPVAIATLAYCNVRLGE